MESTWTWSKRRQAVFVLVFSVIVFLLVAFFLTLSYFNKPKKPDQLIVKEPVVVWSRVFPVTDSQYGAIAYFSNTNKNFSSPKAYYKFSFFDDKGDLIGEKTGRTILKADELFFVFEDDLYFEERPTWTSFSWEEINWNEEKNNHNENDYKVDLLNFNLRSDLETPRLDTYIENTGLLTVPSVEVVALVVDDYENVVTASRGRTTSIPFEANTRLTLSWPGPFSFSKDVCDPPLRTHVAFLNGDEDDSEKVATVFEDFKKDIGEGFSWSFGFNSLEEENEVTVTALKGEAEFIKSRQNPLFLVMFPEEDSVKVVNEILNNFESYDFIKVVPVSLDEEGLFVIDTEEIKKFLRERCIQEPQEIKIYTRILN